MFDKPPFTIFFEIRFFSLHEFWHWDQGRSKAISTGIFACKFFFLLLFNFSYMNIRRIYILFWEDHKKVKNIQLLPYFCWNSLNIDFFKMIFWVTFDKLWNGVDLYFSFIHFVVTSEFRSCKKVNQFLSLLGLICSQLLITSSNYSFWSNNVDYNLGSTPC